MWRKWRLLDELSGDIESDIAEEAKKAAMY
jgi:hypothetical protein